MQVTHAPDPGPTAPGPPPESLWSAILPRALEAARQGLVTEALEQLEVLRATGVLDPDSPDTVWLLATTLDCRLARGDLAEAMAAADELADHLDRPGTAGAVAHHATGELAAALNEPEVAAVHFAAAGARLNDTAADPALVPWRVGAALAALRLGRRTEAAALAHDQVALARATGSPYATALALRTLATTDPGGDRVALLRQARASLRGEPDGRLAAQLDTDLAGLLLLPGEESACAEALGLLRSAEEYAGRHQLWPLQGRVRRLLERLGEPPRRVESEALAALTVSERRIARLAAEGLTNRQISAELVVTVKAVEWHLSHVYRKLGIRSRTRLAGTLGATA